MAEESCGFYAGVILVATGMVFIVGMGVYSIYNPLEGEEINKQVVSKNMKWSRYFYLKVDIQFQPVGSLKNSRTEK